MRGSNGGGKDVFIPTRWNQEDAEELARLARETGLSRSEVVRRCYRYMHLLAKLPPERVFKPGVNRRATMIENLRSLPELERELDDL